MKKSFRVLMLVLALALVATLAVVPVGAKPSGTVDVQILALNDFHGNLEPPTIQKAGIDCGFKKRRRKDLVR